MVPQVYGGNDLWERQPTFSTWNKRVMYEDSVEDEVDGLTSTRGVNQKKTD